MAKTWSHDDKDFAKCYYWWKFNDFVGDNTRVHLGSNVQTFTLDALCLYKKPDEKRARSSEITPER